MVREGQPVYNVGFMKSRARMILVGMLRVYKG